jgi:hypothetical protein
VESELPTKHRKEFELVQALGGHALIPGWADIDDQAAVWFEDSLDPRSERPEPFKILIRGGVAVFLWAKKSERG